MTSKGDEAPRTNPSLIEIVTDAMVITRANINMNMNLTACSRSISSAGNVSGDDESVEFPVLRRVGSFPVTKTTTKVAPCTPPRRPIRSSSLEGELMVGLDLDLDEDDEIDHQKFRRLLLGAETYDDDDANSSEQVEESTTSDGVMGPAMLKLLPRKSSCSAPPKLPSRVGSDSERNTPRITTSGSMVIGRINRDARGKRHHRKSLPSSVFRPLQPIRRRRQRSFIQEMLTPDSESSAKSLRLPPKLPSRSESEKSMDGSTRCAIPASVFCSSSSFGAETASSSQRSTASTDAPKRPRRSLSPIDGESLRSLLDPLHPDNTAITEGELNQKIEDSSIMRRKRKVPVRAKTFSDYEYHNHSNDKSNESCIALLSKNFDLGKDFSASPLAKLGLATPSRTRVPPGRSRTFSFFVVTPSLEHHSDASSSVASRCV